MPPLFLLLVGLGSAREDPVRGKNLQLSIGPDGEPRPLQENDSASGHEDLAQRDSAPSNLKKIFTAMFGASSVNPIVRAHRTATPTSPAEEIKVDPLERRTTTVTNVAEDKKVLESLTQTDLLAGMVPESSQMQKCEDDCAEYKEYVDSFFRDILRLIDIIDSKQKFAVAKNMPQNLADTQLLKKNEAYKVIALGKRATTIADLAQKLAGDDGISRVMHIIAEKAGMVDTDTKEPGILENLDKTFKEIGALIGEDFQAQAKKVYLDIENASEKDGVASRVAVETAAKKLSAEKMAGYQAELDKLIQIGKVFDGGQEGRGEAGAKAKVEKDDLIRQLTAANKKFEESFFERVKQYAQGIGITRTVQESIWKLEQEPTTSKDSLKSTEEERTAVRGMRPSVVEMIDAEYREPNSRYGLDAGLLDKYFRAVVLALP